MQRLFSCCLGRVRRPPPSDGDAGPCAAEPSEVREKPRGGLHGAAAGGDLARLQRHWWRKRFRINRRDAEKHIQKQVEQNTGCEMRGECSAGGTEGPAVLDSSCSGKTADSPLGTPTLTGAGVLPAAGGQEEEDYDSSFDSESDCEAPTKASADELPPAADGKGACAQPVAEESGNGVFPAAGAQQQDDDSPFDSESDCEAPMNVTAGVWIPPAHKLGAWAQPVAEESGNGVFPAAGAQQQDDDSPFDSESDCEAPTKASADELPPAADGKGACAQPVAEESGNGVFPAAGAQQQDDDSPFDSESDCEAPTKASADELPPAADGKGACAQPVAEESGNGVFPAAGAQEQDDDSPFDSESDCEAPMNVTAGVWIPPAHKLGAWAQPVAEESGNGVFPAAGAQQQDDDSPFDSESDCEAPTKASADELPPAADGKGACAQPVAEESGNGVFPAAGAQEQDDDSPFDSESDCEAPMNVTAGVWIPPAHKLGAWAQPVAEESGNGVFPAAGAQQLDDDSPFDSESDCEAPTKASADELPPAADGKGACAQPVAEESGNGVFPAAGAQQQDDDSPFDSESDCEAPAKASAVVQLPPVCRREAWVQPVAEESGNGVFPAAGAQVSAPEREELQLKKDASCQTDLQGDRQTWVKQPWQELANPLKRSSLTEASPEAVKCYSVYLQEQKLQLQKKLYRSKAKLQELKERHTRTECYAEYLKDAIRRNERELTSRNLQDLLTTSSGTAAIPELEDHIRRLQGEKARLETTVQQQAKTIEALWKKLQACALSHNGLEDSVTGFRTTRTAKEHRRRQRGSESKEVKKLGKTQCRSEALPDEAWKRNAALEEEQTRLKMLLQMSSTTLTASAARRRKSQLSFWREMK